MPTILKHCGLDHEIEGSRGIDLLDPDQQGSDRQVISTRFSYPLDRVMWETPYRETYAVKQGRWKLVVRGTPPDETTEVELYDIDQDPLEANDLSTDEAEIAERLLTELTRYLTGESSSRERFIARHLEGNPENVLALSTREKDELEALGYLVD
jgi:arylsulfatase A-like enzyme